MNLAEKLADKFADGGKSSTLADIDLFSTESSWISTGSPSLDYNLQTLGYPCGILEIRGKSRSGKTTLSLHAMMQCIKQYGDRAVVVILSSERRDNKIYAKQLGLPVERIVVHRIKHIEDVFNKMQSTMLDTHELIRSILREELKNEEKKMKVESPEFLELLEERVKEFGAPRFLFVWDSLGQSISAQERNAMLKRAAATKSEDEEKHAAMGSAARALSMGLRSAVGATDEEDATLFIINRPYSKVDGRGGKVSYGGEAIELFPTMRLEPIRIQSVKIGEEEVGQITAVNVIKSDYSNPGQKYLIEIGYGLGIILNEEDIKMGKEAGFLEKFGRAGAKFALGTKSMSWGSRKELYQLYKERHPLLKVLVNKLIKYAHTKVKSERKKALLDD